MAFVDVLAHPRILRRRAAGNVPTEIQDLDDITEYHFRQGSLNTGERFFREFDRKCKQLVAFPHSGKSYEEIRADLRGILLDDYVIFYRILPDSVEILRVLNGRRDFPAIFSEPI